MQTRKKGAILPHGFRLGRSKCVLGGGLGLIHEALTPAWFLKFKPVRTGVEVPAFVSEKASRVAIEARKAELYSYANRIQNAPR
jgi:hypothetical protein